VSELAGQAVDSLSATTCFKLDESEFSGTDNTGTSGIAAAVVSVNLASSFGEVLATLLSRAHDPSPSLRAITIFLISSPLAKN
jgi:hypothetical protein